MTESRASKIKIPQIVREVFDSAYHSHVSPGNIEDCTGQDTGYDKREVVLFPFEEVYLIELLGQDNKLGSGVPAHQDCPYKTEEGKCSIGPHKPIHCRMSPFEIKPVTAREIEFLIKKIPLDSSFVDTGVQYWSGVFISLWSYLSSSWWRYHKETLNNYEFTSVGTIKFELTEDSSPLEPSKHGAVMTYEEMAKYIDPNCPKCGGLDGMIADPDTGHPIPCDCVRRNYWER